MILSSLEESYPVVSAWVPHALFPSRADPQIAQIMLAAIAGSIMTVVSIVFAILLMSFDPRLYAVLAAHPRELRQRPGNPMDAWGFPGNFPLLHGRIARGAQLAAAFASVATVTGALVLALTSVIGLIFFIHHISQAVSVSHIVDRIARETEDVIDEIMPHERGLGLARTHDVRAERHRVFRSQRTVRLHLLRRLAVLGSLTAGDIAFNAISTICSTRNSTSCCMARIDPITNADRNSTLRSAVRRSFRETVKLAPPAV